MTEITCHSCGRAVDDSLRVCPGCGAKIAKAIPDEAAPFGMASEDDVPTIDLEESGATELEVGPPAPEEPKIPAAEIQVEGEAETEVAVEGEAGEAEEAEPRGDTVQMSLSDATKVWVEESGTDESQAPGASEPAPASKLPLVIGVLVVAAIVLTVALVLL